MPKKKIATKKKLVKLSPTLYADKGTYDKVHRHLTDINDTISEEDIENVSTDFVVRRNDQAVLGKTKMQNRKDPGAELSPGDEEKMYEEGEKVTSTWNIVSE